MASDEDYLSRSRSLRDRRMQKSMQEKELQLSIKEARMAEKINQLYEEKDKNRKLLDRIAKLEYELGKKGERLKKMTAQKKRIQENLKNALKKRAAHNEKNEQLKNDAISFLSSLESQLMAFEQKSTLFSENKELKDALDKIKSNIKKKTQSLLEQQQILTQQGQKLDKKFQKSLISDKNNQSHSPLPIETDENKNENKDDNDEKKSPEKSPVPPIDIEAALTNVSKNGSQGLIQNSATSPAIKKQSSEIVMIEPEKTDEKHVAFEFSMEHDSHEKKGKKKRYNKLNVKIESQTNIIKQQVNIGASVSASPFKFEERLLKEQKKKLRRKGNPLKTKVKKLENQLDKANKTIEVLKQEKQELVDKISQLEEN